MSQKNNFRISFVLLLIGLCTLPFFIFKSIIGFLFYTLLIFFLSAASIFFWFSFMPNLPLDSLGLFPTMRVLLQLIFQNTIPLYQVKSGFFFKDYFDIQDKPKILALFIDENSAVVVQGDKGNKRILSSGFNRIYPLEKIIHTFNLQPGYFTIRPTDKQNSLVLFKHPVYLKNNPAFSIIKDQTLARTKDGIAILASFSVFYNLASIQDIHQPKEIFLALSNYFSKQGLNGCLNKEIEYVISTEILNNWRRYIGSHNANELTAAEYSSTFLMDDFSSKMVFSLTCLKALNINIFLNNLWIKKDAQKEH